MKRVIHHVKRHWNKVHKHIRKHHKKYIFGAVSWALVYKVVSVIIASILANPMWISFASWTVDSWTIETSIDLTWDFLINNDDISTTWLEVTLNNNITWATHMRFGNTESDRNIAAWDNFSQTKSRTLDDNWTWTKTVYAQFSGESEILSLQDTIDYLPEIETEQDSWTLEDISTEQDSWTIDVFVADNSPDTFVFNNISDASLTTEHFSNIVTIVWINTWTQISITNWFYKINSNSRTGSDWIIYSGDTLQLKAFSANNYDINETITITVWDVDVDWIITTAASNWICDSTDINVTSPSENDILSWEFDIERSYNNLDCDGDQLTIKLRDANIQYVTVWTADYNDTLINFDSTLLYSGFYNITGLDFSGNVVNIHTWDYTWDNTYYFTWHKIAILNLNNDVMYEWDYFTIDNLAPSIENISINYSDTYSWYVWLWETIDLTFESSEELSWVVVTILWAYANLQNQTDNLYEYTLDFSDDNTQWTIIYNIEFSDLAWHTWYVEWSDTIVFDKTLPNLDNIDFTNSWNIVDVDININETWNVNFVYNLSWSLTWWEFDSLYSQDHFYTTTGLLENQYYNYTLSISDLAKNISYIGWYFMITWDSVDYTHQAINSGNMMVSLWFNQEEVEDENIEENEEEVVETRPATTFRTEIDKFNQCKETIWDFSTMDIPVRKYKARLQMPEMEKTYVRKLVSAFSIVLFERIESAWLTEEEINDLTKEFNNFLVILKLVRDNDNECEQNLSNYYMSKFRKSLIEYNLATE